MDLDEFGTALFGCIQTVGSILQLRDYRQQTPVHRVHAGQLTEWQKREQVLILKLPSQLAQLSDADHAEIIRRYEWVGALC